MRPVPQVTIPGWDGRPTSAGSGDCPRAAGFGRWVTEPASYRKKDYLPVFFNDINRIVAAMTD